MTNLSFSFPVRAMSKDNEKYTGRNGRPFTSKKFKDFEFLLRTYMRSQLPDKFVPFQKEGIVVKLFVWFKNRVRLDAGNIPKSILDAGNGERGSGGLIWKDDRLITDLQVKIFYGPEEKIEMEVIAPT